jgi:hypothetical protein
MFLWSSVSLLLYTCITKQWFQAVRGEKKMLRESSSASLFTLLNIPFIAVDRGEMGERECGGLLLAARRGPGTALPRTRTRIYSATAARTPQLKITAAGRSRYFSRPVHEGGPLPITPTWRVLLATLFYSFYFTLIFLCQRPAAILTLSMAFQDIVISQLHEVDGRNIRNKIKHISLHMV